MEKTKFTNTDRFNAIINILNGLESDIDNNDLITFCENQIEVLAKKAAKAKVRAAAKREASDELTDRIAAVLTSEPMTLNDILAALGDEELTAPKLTSRCKRLIDSGFATKTEVYVAAEDGGKDRKLVAYTLA